MYFFNDFHYFALLEFTKSNLFFAMKMLLNLFNRLVFECLSRCSKGLCFRADVFFNHRILVKYLFQVCDTFLSDYLWLSWRMSVFTVLLLFEKWALKVIHNFLVPVILLECRIQTFHQLFIILQQHIFPSTNFSKPLY